MFSFRKKEEKSVRPRFWFIGVHISSAVRKLEAALVGCSSAKPGSELILQKSVSFDLPDEISTVYRELLEQLRTEQDAAYLKSLDASVPEDAKTQPSRTVRKSSVGADLTRLASLQTMVTEIQQEAISELLDGTNVKPTDVNAVAVTDPGFWTISDLCDPHESFYPISSGAQLSARTGMNVLDSFVPAVWSPFGHGDVYFACPYWLLLGANQTGRLVVDLGETARWTYLPAVESPSSITNVVYQEVVPCGALLNLFTREATKGSKTVDVGGRLSVQGRRPEELLNIWREESLRVKGATRVSPRYYSRSLSGMLNENFYYETLKKSSRGKFSSLDALCASVHWVAESVVQSIEENKGLFKEPFEVILTGACRLNGLLFSRLSASMDKRFLTYSDIGFNEDSFDGVATAVLGALFTADIPAAYPEIHSVKSKTLLGRISPGTPDSWRRCLEFAASKDE